MRKFLLAYIFIHNTLYRKNVLSNREKMLNSITSSEIYVNYLQEYSFTERGERNTFQLQDGKIAGKATFFKFLST